MTSCRQFHAAFVPLAIMSCLPVAFAACTVEVECLHVSMSPPLLHFGPKFSTVFVPVRQNLDYTAFMKLWTRLEVTREESEGEEGEGEEGRERRQQERERRQRERERRQELERQGIYQLYVHICPSATLPAHAEAVPRRRQELPEEAFEGRRTPKEQVRLEKGIKEDTLYGGTIPRTYLPWVSSLRIARLGL